MRAEEIIAIFSGMLAARWGYIPGTSGEVWTQEKQDKATDSTVQKHGSQWIGRRVADCSGAFVYACKKHGLAIYHGSNRIAREYVVELLPPAMAQPGMAAFKGRNPGTEYYALPGEYRPRGKHYNGDAVDYYHIGLVDSDGVSVINAQSIKTGVVRSRLTDGWRAVGYLKAVNYENKGEHEPMADEKNMTVASGGWVNLRAAPDTNAARVEKLYPGDAVTVKMTYDNGWSLVRHGGRQGYVMSKYLVEEPAAPGSSLEIPDGLGELAAWLQKALEANEQERQALTMMQQQLTGAVG